MNRALPIWTSTSPARSPELISELQTLGLRWIDARRPGVEPRGRGGPVRSQSHPRRRADRDGPDLHAGGSLVAILGEGPPRTGPRAVLRRDGVWLTPTSRSRRRRGSTRSRPPTASPTGRSAASTPTTCSRPPSCRRASATAGARRPVSSARSGNRLPPRAPSRRRRPRSSPRSRRRPSSSTP